ncbi:CYTH domain-containing protein [Alkalibacillus almallahensis]|uniref:CYTH domain-containing protein n=1 Tax=Alkalibacillus almallahensis TaxID=1379154 RepID=UPI001FBBC709|nr:CYTH domain-containing protein [Alkalibacillus almallahensis]NIK13218.1 uncharacterized protein YjbK [Alkalibacillus almallahensis]
MNLTNLSVIMKISVKRGEQAMQEIEIEFKNLLERDEYNNLVAHYMSDLEPIRQVNHYFETNDFRLKQQGAALRIREKTDAYVATLKQPVENGLLETHDTLTEEQFKAWCQDEITLGDNIRQQLNTIGIEETDIRYKGQLTTYRYERQDHNIILVLDYSEYNGMTDYELEVEAPSMDQGQAYFHNLLSQFNIPERHTPNKIARFFQSVN